MVGAGRTELIEGLMGLRPSEAESIVLNGREIGSRSVRTLMDAGLVYLTEDRKGKGLLMAVTSAGSTMISAAPLRPLKPSRMR